jgi:pentapeptide MXKDX repeat protein
MTRIQLATIALTLAMAGAASAADAPKMSKMEMDKMASCQKMSKDAMMKDADCMKMSKMHPDMMKSGMMKGDAMAPKGAMAPKSAM